MTSLGQSLARPIAAQFLRNLTVIIAQFGSGITKIYKRDETFFFEEINDFSSNRTILEVMGTIFLR